MQIEEIDVVKLGLQMSAILLARAVILCLTLVGFYILQRTGCCLIGHNETTLHR